MNTARNSAKAEIDRFLEETQSLDNIFFELLREFELTDEEVITILKAVKTAEEKNLSLDKIRSSLEKRRRPTRPMGAIIFGAEHPTVEKKYARFLCADSRGRTWLLSPPGVTVVSPEKLRLAPGLAFPIETVSKKERSIRCGPVWIHSKDQDDLIFIFRFNSLLVRETAGSRVTFWLKN